MNLELGSSQPQRAQSQGKSQWLHTPLINASAVRRLLLEQAKDRYHKFTRVSDQTLTDANEALRLWCVNRVKQTPSKGKTL